MYEAHRLPPLLRVVLILGLLFPLAGLALAGFAVVVRFSSHQWPLDSNRVQLIMVNLIILGLACVSAVANYRTRFRPPDRGPFPLHSWQSRMRFIAVVAALPICSLVLAVVIPPTALAFVIVFPIGGLGALGMLVAMLATTFETNTGR
jgi:hypothetical protein